MAAHSALRSNWSPSGGGGRRTVMVPPWVRGKRERPRLPEREARPWRGRSVLSLTLTRLWGTFLLELIVPGCVSKATRGLAGKAGMHSSRHARGVRAHSSLYLRATRHVKSLLAFP